MQQGDAINYKQFHDESAKLKRLTNQTGSIVDDNLPLEVVNRRGGTINIGNNVILKDSSGPRGAVPKIYVDETKADLIVALTGSFNKR